MSNNTERFSTRVEDYIKYRPGYPPAILDLLRTQTNLSQESIIADIGSGTGKLTELFLSNGNRVFAVEPNTPMRQAAEWLLAGYENFISISGSAESTTLPSDSIDLIVAGQAFHWFDQKKARLEFERILKPHSWVAVIWNERRLNATPFLRAYEDLLLRYGTDYKEVRHENTSATIASFFPAGTLLVNSFDNLQEFDFEGLKGRISSTSYTPEPGSPAAAEMLDALKNVFAKWQSGGRVVFEYDTRVYLGHLS